MLFEVVSAMKARISHSFSIENAQISSHSASPYEESKELCLRPKIGTSLPGGDGTFAEFCKPLAAWRNSAKVPAPPQRLKRQRSCRC